MWLPAERLRLTRAERRRLTHLLRDPLTPKRLVLRASIVLGASDGTSNTQLARELAASRQTVIHWRQMFERVGMRGFLAEVPPAAVKTPATAIAQAGLVAGREHPSGSLLDLVGLFVGPYDKVLAFSVDTESSFRSEPGAAQGNVYVRRLTRSLFGAIGLLLVENLAGQALPNQGFLEFLERIDRTTPERRPVHLIVDSRGSHKASQMKAWFDAHRRIHVHCTPRDSVWVGLAKRWCLTQVSGQQMRLGTPAGFTKLAAAIGEHIEGSEGCLGPFIWTVPATSFCEAV